MGKIVLHTPKQKDENILYIIGNGFDLAHGMKTSYENFRQWLNTYEPSAVYRLESLYRNINNNGKWYDIEKALGSVTLKETIEFDVCFQECPDEINGENSSQDAYQCGDNIKMVVDTLPSQLKDWIASVDTKKVCRKFEIAKDAKFLSFNYTNTLEDVYGIDKKNILHIHEVIIDSRPLVVGYGDSIFEHEKYESDNSEVDTERIKNILSHCRKPVMEILEEPKPKSWFEGLSNISAVIVYGHSCSKVDKPYFEKVANCIKDDAHWVFHVHDENENPYFKAFAEKIKKGSQIYEIINP